jgi:thymidylate kinase
LRPSNGRRALVVEFIGVSGVGKSTLVAAVTDCLSKQGYRVREAEQVILARYGLALPRFPRLRSALVHLLALKPFGRYLLTREGQQLSRLAVSSIVRDAGSLWIGVSLLRNFWKRIGSHLLLESLRHELDDCDVVLCDEGVVHAAHNLFVHTRAEPNPEEIVRFGRMVPQPDHLIWVTAPPAQSAEVIRQRGHSRVHASTAAARAFAEHAHATFEVLAGVEGLREKIYRVDNSANGHHAGNGAVGARASVIGEFLKKHLQRCQEPWPRFRPLGLPSTTNGRCHG